MTSEGAMPPIDDAPYRNLEPTASLGRAAVALSEMGLRVFPLHHPRPVEGGIACSCGSANCAHIGKHPRTAHGFKDGTVDRDRIGEWWARWPASNIGLCTGSEAGVVVIDIDRRHDGHLTMAALERQHGRLPDTVEVVTGNGRHLYFAHPGGRVACGTPARGIDVKADGGYIVAPPSLHETGRRYTFQPSKGLGELPFAQLPDWLLGMLNWSGGKGSKTQIQPGPTGPIPEGQRNSTLTALAGSMRRRGASGESILAELRADNAARCQPPLQDRELEAIAKSVARYSPQLKVTEPVAPRAWSDPIPLYERRSPCAFPLMDAFPGALSDIRDFVAGVAHELQVPVDLPAMLIPPLVAVAIAKKYEIEVREGWRENTAMWTLTLMQSGERKSGTFRKLMEPLHEWERDEAERLAPLIAAELEEREMLDEERKAARRKGSQGDLEQRDRAKQIAQQLAERGPPQPPTLITTDATSEALVSMLISNDERALVASAEADALDVMLGRYDAKGEPNMGVWLCGYAGDRVRVHRKKQHNEFLDRPALSVAMTVQPEAVRGMFSSSTARGRGLLARFFVSLPDPKVGYRTIAPPPVAEHLHMAYVNAIRRLLDIPVEIDAGPRIVRLTSEAGNLFLEFESKLEVELRPDGALGDAREWGAKLCGGIARIALVLHSLTAFGRARPPGEPDNLIVSMSTMKAALSWAPYLIEHERLASGLAGSDPVVAIADKLLGWLQRTRVTEFSRRDCFTECRSVLLKIVEEVDQPLALLEDCGYVRQIPLTEPRPGKPPSPRYEVNPLWKRGAP